MAYDVLREYGCFNGVSNEHLYLDLLTPTPTPTTHRTLAIAIVIAVSDAFLFKLSASLLFRFIIYSTLLHPAVYFLQGSLMCSLKVRTGQLETHCVLNSFSHGEHPVWSVRSLNMDCRADAETFFHA